MTAATGCSRGSTASRHVFASASRSYKLLLPLGPFRRHQYPLLTWEEGWEEDRHGGTALLQATARASGILPSGTKSLAGAAEQGEGKAEQGGRRPGHLQFLPAPGQGQSHLTAGVGLLYCLWERWKWTWAVCGLGDGRGKGGTGTQPAVMESAVEDSVI